MLRNSSSSAPHGGPAAFLNEVLSLNAQELYGTSWQVLAQIILNEVLSLNAQECIDGPVVNPQVELLNEVLSLNAQESRVHREHVEAAVPQ